MERRSAGLDRLAFFVSACTVEKTSPQQYVVHLDSRKELQVSRQICDLARVLVMLPLVSIRRQFLVARSFVTSAIFSCRTASSFSSRRIVSKGTGGIRLAGV